MTQANTPYTLSETDLSGSPEDVVAAVMLLQAHGFVVTREPIQRLRASVALTQAEIENGDPDSIRRWARKQLSVQIGEQVFSVATGTRTEENTAVRYTAVADIIRPSRGLNSISEIIGK